MTERNGFKVGSGGFPKRVEYFDTEEEALEFIVETETGTLFERLTQSSNALLLRITPRNREPTQFLSLVLDLFLGCTLRRRWRKSC